ncbi:MAG TPA: tail fiber domain-containing protein [Saprospiraceae bacterium]|nr:tail fiber domain-containing protein [Saprospiraceae bacterium]
MNTRSLLCICAFFHALYIANAQNNVAINSDGSAPDSSAMLDIKSNSRGLLIPRMTTAQKTAIASPATGLMVYDTDSNTFWCYAGMSWIEILSGYVTLIQDADTDTKVEVEQNPDEDIIRFTIAGTEYFRMDSGRLEVVNTGGSIFIGEEAGANDNFAGNVGIGRAALKFSTNRWGLVAIGDSALWNNGTGATDGSHSTRNTAVGSYALYSNTTGWGNTALGHAALPFNSTGFVNTAVGRAAMFNNTIGTHNTAVGNFALLNNTEGLRNTAIGNLALFVNDTSDENTALGASALIVHLTGDRNTAVGHNALGLDSTGYYNTAIGVGSLQSNVVGNSNTAIGYAADVGYDSLTNAIAIGANALVNKSNSLVLGNGAHVGIGTSDPDTTLHVVGSIKMVDGNQATGRVMISDANGVGFWTDPLSFKTDTLSIIADADADTKVETEQDTDEDTIRFTVAGFEIGKMDNERFYVQSPGRSLFIGKNAGLNDDGTNNENIFVGYDAGRQNTAGISNTVFGYQGLKSNTAGTFNTAVGHEALEANITGQNNSAFGNDALLSNTTGIDNTAIGGDVLKNNTSGSNNTALGRSALGFNITGQYNVAVGSSTLATNTADYNTGIGALSLSVNTTGEHNVGMGYSANMFNLTGSRNTIVGYESGRGTGVHSKSGNVFLGYRSGYKETGSNKLYIHNDSTMVPLVYGEFDNSLLRINGKLITTGGLNDLDCDTKIQVEESPDEDIIRFDLAGTERWVMLGSRLEPRNSGNAVLIGENAGLNNGLNDNVAIGFEAMKDNTSGFFNTALGSASLRSNTSGSRNIAIGYASLDANTSGADNVSIGNSALGENSSGNANIAVGGLSLEKNTSGNENTAIGFLVLNKNTTASYNTGLGSKALFLNTTGGFNTAVGYGVLRNNTIGNSNTGIGYDALESNSMGEENTGLGHHALWQNTTGTKNTAVGGRAAGLNTIGEHNVVLGVFANYYNEEGSNNTIIGYNAGMGSSQHDKSGNVFIGYQAGMSDTTDNKLYIENSNSTSPLIYGDFDTDLLRVNGTFNINNAYSFPSTDGSNGKVLRTDGAGTLSWGNQTLIADNDNDTKVQVEKFFDDDIIRFDLAGTERWIMEGVHIAPKNSGSSVYIGEFTGDNDDLSSNGNVGIGLQSMNMNETGANNAAIGSLSLEKNTSGNQNTAIGALALNKNTTASYNTGIGGKALFLNTTGEHNTAVGYDAIQGNTTGSLNTGVGRSVLFYNTTGEENAALGYDALEQNTTGNKNTAAGASAARLNTIGANNVALGAYANYYNEQGSNNTIIGYNAGMGSSQHDKSGNVSIGYQAGMSDTTDNKLYIENSNSTSPLIYGDFDNDILRTNGDLYIYHPNDTAVAGLRIKNTSASDYWRLHTSATDGDLYLFNTSIAHYVGHFDLTTGAYSQFSDARLKKAIQPLEPVLAKTARLNPQTYHYLWQPESDQRSVGFLAQDVLKIFPEAVSYNQEEDQYSINYDVFGVIAIKAIQELDTKLERLVNILSEQHSMIEGQDLKIGRQQAQIDELKEMVLSLQK